VPGLTSSGMKSPLRLVKKETPAIRTSGSFTGIGPVFLGYGSKRGDGPKTRLSQGRVSIKEVRVRAGVWTSRTVFRSGAMRKVNVSLHHPAVRERIKNNQSKNQSKRAIVRCQSGAMQDLSWFIGCARFFLGF
jgi:hypothetical protein